MEYQGIWQRERDTISEMFVDSSGEDVHDGETKISLSSSTKVMVSLG